MVRRYFGTGGAVRGLAIGMALAAGFTQAAHAQEQDAPEQPVIEFEYTPISAERLNEMVPKHPGYLGALAPANLNADRPPAPINVTGTWFVDLSAGFSHFLFGPDYPPFGPEGIEALIEAPKAAARNETYRDAIGQCYPPGMPMIMTRVWPHAFIQLPTAIYMISGFNNSVRTIFLDGREFSDPNIVVPSYNGESIGHFEGDTLVVRSKYFEPDNHFIDRGIPISYDFEMEERIRLLEGGTVMEIEFIMTDPNMWEGEWRSTKRFGRQDYTDINESNCILAYNANLPGTDLGSETAEDRGYSNIEGVSDDE
ncbi:hypothetical protein [Alteraurantiacibacter aquimixticola]|uniref:Uncharacterized protein n=1 Tax=Alteraurantiacibacter aquimixticola TaxID=2489173 RepID=A0A4T3F432_9SPHN|nr:hypothetical protein [Alteraurantiacibacter aquimixticola]TIX51898.1 hypothetical protein E5222_05520 [Alteraurantiacibacter aquimixticola]